MPPKANPKKLNTLQLKTLTLIQELAQDPSVATKDPATGNITIGRLPHPHGNHFHLGRYVVMKADANGLENQGVWMALIRKGLVVPGEGGMALTPEGQAYETGLREAILHGSDH
ncbi:hypothetical protein F1188_15325 [Roseospira marina]|uniref:Uncharacterized protein n=1 Tax=Roseospira marina TaxID=140057 RepID=A0A5M6I8R6_9PROT|nr:hypothetical protein [Roseospira marina]KAA5604581.1 hypothetical protein F1188_15325 [Roseospira marina]MBB4315331.1 hypothetical protein [Roseospira marina]MBB5088330.1 hypothetical protein [Roseospira marina]